MMIKLGDLLRESVMPRLSGDKVALTSFETHLKTCLLAMRHGEYACLVVDLLPGRNAEGFDYTFTGIPMGCDLWGALRYFQKPVIALDTLKNFDEQWPEELRGTVKHPRELGEKPLLCIPDYRNTPNVIPLFGPNF